MIDPTSSDVALIKAWASNDPAVQAQAASEWKRRVSDPIMEILNSVTQEEVNADCARIWQEVQAEYRPITVVITPDPVPLVNGHPPCS
jgi:hypothetical protein